VASTLAWALWVPIAPAAALIASPTALSPLQVALRARGPQPALFGACVNSRAH